jgi:MFS family permease
MTAVPVAARPIRPRTVLAVCLGTGFTTLLDQAMLTVAVPSIRADLGADGAELQWILAVYSLAFGLALVPAGRLGDAYGRAPLLVGGLALFSSASVLGMTAGEPWLLVLARLLQGIGAGAANPQVIGLLQDHFRGAQRVRAFGAYAAVTAASGAVAPMLGGAVLALADTGGWRLVVAVNIPFGLATCAAALRTLPLRPVRPAAPVSLDGIGMVLLTVATLGVLLPVVGTGGSGVWLGLAVAAVATFVWWERRTVGRGRTPILLPALARSRGFVLGTAVALCWFGATLGSTVVIVMFLQEGLGLSPLAAGLCTIPSAVGMAVTSTLAWRVVGRWGRPSVTIMLGLLATVLALMIGGLLVLPAAGLVPMLVVAELLIGLAAGLITSPNQGLTLAHAPPGAAGVAAGFFQVSQRISATVVLAATTGVFVAAAVPGDLPAHRGGLAGALSITLAMILVAAVASALEGEARSRSAARQCVV